MREKHTKIDPKGKGSGRIPNRVTRFGIAGLEKERKGGSRRRQSARDEGAGGQSRVECRIIWAIPQVESFGKSTSSGRYLHSGEGDTYDPYIMYVPQMYRQSIPLIPRAISRCFVTVRSTPLSVSYALIGGTSWEGHLTALGCSPHRLRLHPF